MPFKVLEGYETIPSPKEDSGFKVLEGFEPIQEQPQVDLPVVEQPQLAVDETKLPWAVDSYKDINPNTASKLHQISNEKKIPFDVLVSNKEEYLKYKETEDLGRKIFAKDDTDSYMTPVTAKYLSDPAKLALNRQDVDTLINMETAIKDNGSWYKKAGQSLLEGTKDAARSALDIEKSILEFIGKRTEDGDLLPTNPAVIGLQLINSISQGKDVELIENLKNLPAFAPVEVKGDTKVAQYAYDFIRMVPQVATSLAAGFAGGPLLSGAVMGSQIYGSTYGQLRDKGVDPDRAAMASVGNSLFQGILEAYGAGKVLEAFKSTGAKQIALNFLTAIVAEGGTEFLQAFPESAAMIWGEAKLKGQTPEEQAKLFMEGLGDTAKQGLYEGMLVAPMALLGASVKLPMDFRKMRQLNKDLELWQYLTDTAKVSELRKNNPVEFENKLRADMEAHNVSDNVYVSTETLETYYQDDKKLRKFLKEMNVEEAYDSAKAGGTDLEISRAKWITKYAEAEEAVALAKDLRFDPNSFSMKESEEALKDAVQAMKNLHNEYNNELKKIEYPPQVQAMRKALLDSGVKAEKADTQLAILLAGSKVFTKFVGESNTEWFNRVNPFLEITEGKEGKLGSVSFKDGETKIELMKSANSSTLAHEISHILTKEFIRAANINAGEDPLLLADYENLKQFVGGKFDEEAFEKIGDVFETYLMTSKAPSVKLENVFYKYNQWMAATYKAAKEYETISPEIAGIFDRWLASEKEIEEAMAYYNEKKTLIDLMGEVEEADKQEVEAKRAKATQKAVSAQANKAIKTFYEIRGGKKKALQEQAVSAVNEQPVYAAINRAVELGGVDPDDILNYVTKDQQKLIKSKHKGFIAKRFKDKSEKAYNTYHSLVLSYGGININSVIKAERPFYFGEGAGSYGVFKKGARGIDQVAQEMVMDGVLEDDGNGSVELLLNLLKEQAKYVDPDKAQFLNEFGVPEYTSVSELAAMMDFDSAEALIDEVLKADSKYAAVTKESKIIAQNMEDNIRRSFETFENVKGDEAFHSDDRFVYLLKEAQVLQKQLNKDVKAIKDVNTTRSSFTDATVIRNTAKQLVNNKKVKDARDYRLYSFAEKKYADRAYKALKEGDQEEALKFRRLQLVNHAAVQECIRVRDEIVAIENRYETKKLQGNFKNSEVIFNDAVAFLANKYKLNETKTLKKQVPEKMPDLSKEDELLYTLIPDWVLTQNKINDYKNLTVNQLRELDESLQSIIHFGRNELTTYKEGIAKQTADYVAEVKEYAQYIPDFIFDRKALLNVTETVMSYGRQMEFITERLDNFSKVRTQDVKVKDADGNEVILKAENKYGPSKDFFYNRPSDLEGVNDVILGTLYTKVKPAVATLRKAMRRIAAERQANYRGSFDLPEFPIPENMRKSGIHKWDGEMMVAFMLNMGNESNMEAITNAYGYSPEQCLEMSKYFEADELLAIQSLWDTIETLYPKISETYYNVYRKKMSKVNANPINVITRNGAFIELKGGYYPLSFDRRTQLFTKEALGKLVGKGDVNTVEDIHRNRLASLTHSVKVTDGFVHDRKSGHFLPPKLSLSVMFEHLSDAARYISFAEYTRDIHKVINNKDWRRLVTEKLGPDNLARIEEWAQYLALPERRNLDVIDALAEDQRQKAAMSYLLFKFGTGVKQRAAMFTGMKEIGFKWAMKGLLQTNWKTSVFGIGHTAQYEYILAKSAFMKTRAVSMDREMRSLAYSYQNPFFTKKLGSIGGKDITLSSQSIAVGDFEITAKDVQQFAFKWLEMNDRAVNVPIWLGAYAKSMDETANTSATYEERDVLAIKHADDAVRRSQPSNRPVDLSTAQRSEGFMRWMTTVMSWSLKFGNRKGEQWRAMKAGQISKADYAAHIFYEILAPAAFTTLVGMGLKGDAPEPEDILWATAGNICQGNFITDNIAGSVKYGKGQSFAPLEGVDKILKVGYDIKGVVEGKTEYDLLLKDVAGAFSYQLGVPIPNLVKEGYKLKEGLEDR